MLDEVVTVLDGSTFMVSGRDGDMEETLSAPQGLFFQDVRHLSRWALLVDGKKLRRLSARTVEYDTAEFALAPESDARSYPTLLVVRRRWVCNALREHLTVSNEQSKAVAIQVCLLVDADFRDVFEVKDGQPARGEVTREPDDGVLALSYAREDFRRSTRVQAKGAFATARTLTFDLRLGAHETWETELVVQMGTGHQTHRPKTTAGRPNMDRSLAEWIDDAPALESSIDTVARTYSRSIRDLAALRFYPRTVPDSSLPAAGLPWFMALFGRDSIIASYQALPFAPELARTTLLALASRQANEFDDFRDSEPGKILHELRHGELTYFHERPQSPYYGTADATPLFLVLLDEYEQWTGDTETVARLEGAARRALEWTERYGDLDGDGYVEFKTRNPVSGLTNQCWKDSWNGIVHPDGRLAKLPRATCEIQGYVYDAWRRTARLAREVWHDGEEADRLDTRAEDLRRRFNQDFWVDKGSFFALALDGDNRRVPTLTSNMGHLLWSGIVEDERVDDVVRHLMGDRLWSGWGIRTLAAGQPAFNPLGYHVGTVWPHDCSIIAAGLLRYNRREEATRIAAAMFEAADAFDNRLPEAFAGLARSSTSFPVEYPSACSPQAWAAGAPLLLLRVLLGMNPANRRLESDACLPEGWRLALDDVPGSWGRARV